MNKRPKNPLDLLGKMPDLPADWEQRPVQQNRSEPLAPGFRWPLPAYRRIEVADINEMLAREERR